MKYRKLRITWSVAWGVACVLLVVLWMRSYSSLNFCELYVGRGMTIHIQTVNGRALFFNLPINRGFSFGGFSVRHVAASSTFQQPVVGAPLSNGGISVQGRGSQRGTSLPIWPGALIAIALASVVWLPWRFSLRTLLIGMTVLAALLGLVVWAVR